MIIYLIYLKLNMEAFAKYNTNGLINYKLF